MYFHRALTQLLDLHHPILLRQTSVDIDAAAFSPVHLATSYEMLTAFVGHYLRIDPLFCYQVVGHVCVAFSLPFVFYWCARIFGLDRWLAAMGALLDSVFCFSPMSHRMACCLARDFRLSWQPLDASTPPGWWGSAPLSGYLWQGKPIIWILFLPIGLALSYRFLLKGTKAT